MSERLESASDVAAALNPRRLRLARELRGWTQAELGAEVEGGLSSAAISQLENGRTRPTAATVRSLSDALDFPMRFFLLRDGDDDPPGFFRRLQSVPARERRKALGRAQMLYDLVVAIERHLRLPEIDVPRAPGGVRTPEEIEKLAGRVRRYWEIEPGPVPHVVRTLERQGVIVARFAMDRSDIDGFSVWHEDHPVVVLGDDKGVAARSRFDAAHELGHLVMHGPDRAGSREAEKEAHRFAAAFLMPEEDIREQLPQRADWRLLVDLKAEWGVSVGALLQRAKDLRRMSDHAHLNAMKAMSARGWRKDEPGDELLGSPEGPRMLAEALRHLEREMGVTLADLAAEAGLPLAEIERIATLSSDSRPTLDF